MDHVSLAAPIDSENGGALVFDKHAAGGCRVVSKTIDNSKELQTLMLEMADTIAGLNRRVAELQTKVDAIGSVTLNDLMKKSA